MDTSIYSFSGLCPLLEYTDLPGGVKKFMVITISLTSTHLLNFHHSNYPRGSGILGAPNTSYPEGDFSVKSDHIQNQRALFRLVMKFLIMLHQPQHCQGEANSLPNYAHTSKPPSVSETNAQSFRSILPSTADTASGYLITINFNMSFLTIVSQLLIIQTQGGSWTNPNKVKHSRTKRVEIRLWKYMFYFL